MRQVSALPLRAVGFGRDRVAARVCLDATQAALRTLPDYRRLYDLLRREAEDGDHEGPTLRFLQSMVDELAEANLISMGLDEPDSVSVFIDIERLTTEPSTFEIGTTTPYVVAVHHSPADDRASVSDNI